MVVPSGFLVLQALCVAVSSVPVHGLPWRSTSACGSSGAARTDAQFWCAREGAGNNVSGLGEAGVSSLQVKLHGPVHGPLPPPKGSDLIMGLGLKRVYKVYIRGPLFFGPILGDHVTTLRITAPLFKE